MARFMIITRVIRSVVDVTPRRSRGHDPTPEDGGGERRRHVRERATRPGRTSLTRESNEEDDASELREDGARSRMWGGKGGSEEQARGLDDPVVRNGRRRGEGLEPGGVAGPGRAGEVSPGDHRDVDAGAAR